MARLASDTRGNPHVWRGRLRLALTLLLFVGLAMFAILMAQRYFQVDEVELPDVLGLDSELATERLRALELAPETFPDNVATLAPGVVTSQRPSAGALVRRGRSVSIGVNSPPEASRAPQLIGLSMAQASRSLDNLQLQFGEVAYEISDKESGQIIGQSPEGGDALGESSSISVRVSRGQDIPSVSLPTVIGLPLNEAERRLAALGFKGIETVPTGVTTERQPTVNMMVPAAGQAVPISAPITLNYDLPNTQVILVPYLNGLSLRRARSMLRTAGLSVGSITLIDDPSQPKGVVQYQPAGYTLTRSPISMMINGTDDEGAITQEIDLGAPPGPSGLHSNDSFDDGLRFEESAVIESGDQAPLLPGGRTVPFRFDPASLGVQALQNQDYHLRLVVTDDEGERIAINELVPAGQVISESVRISGDALLQTYINDIFFQAWSP